MIGSAMVRRSALPVLVLLLLATATPLRAQDPNCSTLGQNLFVRSAMTDIYLWASAVPNVDPASFDSPEAYLEAVRYRPLDQTFSYITDRASNDAFFSESQFIGFGLSTSTSTGELRVTQVFMESPADEAGLSRGDRIVQINGRNVADLIASGEIDGAFGPADIGVVRELVFDHAGRRLRAQLTKRLVTIPTVSTARVIHVGSRNVGYLFFRNFVEPSVETLNKWFTAFLEWDVNELVLDLRYNGGGLVGVAQHLASLIGGVRTDGQVFASYTHNERNASRNQALRFEHKPNALALDRVVVITTRAW